MNRKYFFIVLMILVIGFIAGCQKNISPKNPAEKVPDEIIAKINKYVINQSSISEEYFYSHFELIEANKTPYNCLNGGCKDHARASDFCFRESIPECNYTYAVHAFWQFKIGDYEALAGDRLSAKYDEPFIFIIENGQVKEYFRYVWYEPKYQNLNVSDYAGNQYVNLPFPKFREINTTIPKAQLEGVINDCVDGPFEEDDVRLAPIEPGAGELSLLYHSTGKKEGNSYLIYVNLETGDSSCSRIYLGGLP